MLYKVRAGKKKVKRRRENLLDVDLIPSLHDLISYTTNSNVKKSGKSWKKRLDNFY